MLTVEIKTHKYTTKTSTHRQKHITLGPDSSKYNSIYGVLEIVLVGFI